jgi:hypothetical protein
LSVKDLENLYKKYPLNKVWTKVGVEVMNGISNQRLSKPYTLKATPLADCT